MFGEDFEQSVHLPFAGVAEAGLLTAEFGIVVAGVAAEFVDAAGGAGLERGDQGVERAGVEGAGGGDAEGAVGGDLVGIELGQGAEAGLEDVEGGLGEAAGPGR